MQQLISSPMLQEYIDLTLREVSIVNPSDEANSRSIELHTVLNNENKILIILFEGVGGSGKTFLSRHICKEWASKKLLKQFRLLIHVQVKDPEIQSARCLSDIIPYPDRNVCNEIATTIYDQKGRGVCFLLDGLGEASSSLLDLFFSDRQRARLPQVSFIATSRPNIHITSHLQSVRLKCKIMLGGFSPEKLHEFLKGALGKQSSSYLSLVEKFEANPQLEWVCTHPINAFIITFLAQISEGDLPVTQTELYRALINQLLIQHLKKVAASSSEPITIESYKNFPSGVIKQPFLRLCELAYDASFSKRRIFTAKQLGQANIDFDNTLGFLQVQPKITMYGTERYYSFPHLTIQEFFAAVHLSSKPDEVQATYVRQLFEADPLNNALPFYAGLTGLTDRSVQQLFSEVLRNPLGDLITWKKLKVNPAESNDPRRKTLALFNCLYECRHILESLADLPDMLHLPHLDMVNKPLQALAGKNLKPGFKNQHTVSFTGLGMTPSDCIAVGYFMRTYTTLVKEASLIAFQLGICSDVGLALFMKEVRKGVNTRTPSQLIIKLSHSTIGKNSLPAFKEMLRGQSNVTALHIFRGISSVHTCGLLLKSILEGLAYGSLCHAVTLSDIGVNSSHVHCLSLMFLCCTLDGLSIIEGDLSSKAMRLFSEALKVATLRSLTLLGCKIDDTGLLLLGKAISVNRHIELLSFVSLKISLDGVMKFLKMFKDTQSSFLGLIINDEIFGALSRIPEYKILLQALNDE